MLKKIVVFFCILTLLSPLTAVAVEIELPNPPVPKIFKVDLGDIQKSCEGDNCYLSIPWIGKYISQIYEFAVSITAIIATVVIMIAGLMWLTAGGNTSQVESAKSYIQGAVLGLILMLGSYTLLFVINPNLVKFNNLRLAVVKNEPLNTIISGGQSCIWQTYTARNRNALKCDAEYEEEDGVAVEKCGENTKTLSGSNTGFVCCCQTPKYQSASIAAQQNHASEELSNLIACIQNNGLRITINSISDSDFITGNCQPWDPKEKFGDDNNCVHTKNSAHYGGTKKQPTSKNDTGFSCAADIDDVGIDYTKFAEIVRLCNDKAFVDDETSHYHISVPDCGVN